MEWLMNTKFYVETARSVYINTAYVILSFITSSTKQEKITKMKGRDFHQHTEKFSPTYFTNTHLNFCLHQHTFSPTFRKFFTNITTAVFYSPKKSYEILQKWFHKPILTVGTFKIVTAFEWSAEKRDWINYYYVAGKPNPGVDCIIHV